MFKALCRFGEKCIGTAYTEAQFNNLTNETEKFLNEYKEDAYNIKKNTDISINKDDITILLKYISILTLVINKVYKPRLGYLTQKFKDTQRQDVQDKINKINETILKINDIIAFFNTKINDIDTDNTIKQNIIRENPPNTSGYSLISLSYDPSYAELIGGIAQLIGSTTGNILLGVASSLLGVNGGTKRRTKRNNKFKRQNRRNKSKKRRTIRKIKRR